MQPDAIYGKRLDVRRAKEPSDYLYDHFAFSDCFKCGRRCRTRCVMTIVIVLNLSILGSIAVLQQGAVSFAMSSFLGVLTALLNQVIRFLLVVLVMAEKHNSQVRIRGLDLAIHLLSRANRVFNFQTGIREGPHDAYSPTFSPRRAPRLWPCA